MAFSYKRSDSCCRQVILPGTLDCCDRPRQVEAAVITAHDFLLGRRCLKLAWHRFNAPELLAAPDPAARWAAWEAQKVKALARELFPAGVQTPREGATEERLAATSRALRQRATVYDAVFAHNGGLATVDIVAPAVGGGWDLAQVSSGMRSSRQNLEALAFRSHIAGGAGVPVRRVFLLRVNGGYIRQGAINPREFFTFEEVTAQVGGLGAEVDGILNEIQATARRRESPEPGLGPYCEEPQPCPLQARCWAHVPPDNVFQLHRLRREQAFAFARSGVLALQHIPPGFSPTKPRRIQLTTLATGRSFVDRPALAGFLSRIQYPIHFLDFETFATALPPFDGLRPYQQTLFQFSLQVAPAAGAPVAHHSFLAEGPGDPRPALLSQLSQHLGESGSILAYNAKFELGVLAEAGAAFPRHAAWLEGLRPRFVDLLAPFKGFAYYHPAQKGSASLKAVLPALTGRGYEDLAIREGNTASFEFLRAAYGEATAEERQATRRNLEAYCRRDTEAMVWILAELQKLAAG